MRLKWLVFFILLCFINQTVCSKSKQKSHKSNNKDEKTFPGADVVISSLLPVIESIIIPGLISGFPPVGSANLPNVPPLSLSHSTSVASSINKKPIAISHSGSISTSPGVSTSASGNAIVQKPNYITESSSSSNPINKLFKTLSTNLRTNNAKMSQAGNLNFN